MIFRLLMLAGLALGATNVLAYNCDNSCTKQCRVVVLGTVQTNPACQAACEGWKAINCSSNPLLSACGEVGANAYVGASNEMFSRSVGKRRRHLTFAERTMLKDMYDREILMGAEIHFGVQPMDKIGGGQFQMSAGSIAQTYGYNIYVKDSNADNGGWSWITTLAHELKHVQQFINRGRNLNRFGRDYFEGWCNAGFNYNHIPMEREAFGIENQAGNAFNSFGGISASDKRWALTCISNKTNFEVKYQTNWNGGDWSSYTVAPNSWRSHWHEYTYANENRSPKMYLRFDFDLQNNGSQFKQYVINQFASSHTDCNRQSQHEEFKYTDNNRKIDLFRNY